MKLRARLAVTIVLTTIPFGVGASYVQREFRLRASDESVAEAISARMQAGGLERCEASPANWPPSGRAARQGRERSPRWTKEGRRPTKRERRARRQARRERRERAQQAPSPRSTGERLGRIVPYGADYQSQRQGVPGFPAELRRALSTGERYAATTLPHPSGRGMHRVVAVRVDVEGPCAVLTVARPIGGTTAWDPQMWIVPVATTVVAMLIALLVAGPLVRRTRRLARMVRGGTRGPGGGLSEPLTLRGNDELSELAQAFEERRKETLRYVAQVESRDGALRDYVANTTHDLMVPLSVLQGHLAALRKQAGAPEGVSDSTLSHALEEAHYLGALVHNLNAAAKLEAGEGHVVTGEVNLNTLVERVVIRHRTVAREREVSVEFATPNSDIWVAGDITLLEQALSNIVHNAIRYNRSAGNVAVLLEQQAPDGFRICVIDDGPGVSESELARLVERRFRSDAARQRDRSGSGLGLAISHEVAERHGMRLVFARRAEGGLSVELSGPRKIV